MAPKMNEKPNSSILVQKPFYISAQSLCNNQRLKRKRIWLAEKLRAYDNNLHCGNNTRQPAPKINVHKQPRKVQPRRFEKLQADVTIDLLSDEEEAVKQTTKQRSINEQRRVQRMSTRSHRRNAEPEIVQQENRTNNWVGLDVERARILGLMPVSCKKTSTPEPPPNNVSNPKRKTRKVRENGEKSLSLIASETNGRPSLPLSGESIVLSDDSQDGPPLSESNVHCECENNQDLFLSQNSIQVDEVTVSLVPRSKSTRSCRRKSHCAGLSTPFPMLPDETVVQTVIANRIYELSLDKLREGLANCGVPEFNNTETAKISPQHQNRTNCFLSPPTINTGGSSSTPVSLKLSSDLSISLISDDDDDEEEISHVETNLLHKLPLNVSISQINSGRSSKIPKRKLG